MQAASAAGHRPNSPVDQDLQNLYNEVWAGFSEETPTASAAADRDIDNIYSVYGADSDYSTSPTVSNSTVSNGRSSCTYMI